MREPLGCAWRFCLLAGLAASASAAAPVANDDAYTTPRYQNLVVNAPGVLSNDTDADGNALTAMLTSAPGNGTLTLDPSGAFTYDPDGAYYGTDSFSYEVSDGTSTSNIAVVTLTVSAGGGGGGGGGYGSGGALTPALLMLLAALALYPRGLKPSKRRCISP